MTINMAIKSNNILLSGHALRQINSLDYNLPGFAKQIKDSRWPDIASMKVNRSFRSPLKEKNQHKEPINYNIRSHVSILSIKVTYLMIRTKMTNGM